MLLRLKKQDGAYIRNCGRKIANILKINIAPFWIPVAALLALASLCWLTGFNGLYGQDAHAYLQQSRLFFNFLQDFSKWPVREPLSELASGYPFAGACVRLLVGDAVLALQLVSLLSYAGSIWLFQALLRQLTPGAHAASRLSYTILLCAMAPLLVRAGVSSMSDALGLMLCMATLLAVLRTLQDASWRYPLGAVIFAASACIVRFSNAPLLAPMLLAFCAHLLQRKRGLVLAACVLAGMVALLPLFWQVNWAQHSMWQDWSAWNLFRRSFVTTNGQLSYYLPNICHVLLYPVLYYGFSPFIGLLFVLFRRTDLQLYSKKIVLACLAVHLLFLATVSGQNARYLIPDYVLLLCLLFPAWDRMHAYGFYFLKWKWMRWILGVFCIIQIADTTLLLRPMLHRSQLERHAAAQISAVVPDHAILYAFDLDVALKSYLPGLQYRNLWEQRYPDFEPGAYVLFNEAKLAKQWAGKNPMLNWEQLNATYTLDTVQDIGDSWLLYRISEQD